MNDITVTAGVPTLATAACLAEPAPLSAAAAAALEPPLWEQDDDEEEVEDEPAAV